MLDWSSALSMDFVPGGLFSLSHYLFQPAAKQGLLLDNRMSTRICWVY